MPKAVAGSTLAAERSSFQRPGFGKSRLGLLPRLLEVVLRNRRHRRFEDLWIPASPLRKPRDDEQQRPDEEDRKPDDLCLDRRRGGGRSPADLHDEPLRQARNHGTRDAQEPTEEPERNQVHLFAGHARAPRLLSYLAYHHMIPMNANPIRIGPIVLATVQGQGAISWRLANGGTVTPWSGSTTAPLASVKSPYNTGPPVGFVLMIRRPPRSPLFPYTTLFC